MRVLLIEDDSATVILSGFPGIEDKVRGLGFGADDYMTKPFHKDELVARIHAIYVGNLATSWVRSTYRSTSSPGDCRSWSCFGAEPTRDRARMAVMPRRIHVGLS